MKLWRQRVLEYGTYILLGVTPVLYFGSRFIPHTTSKTFFFYGVVEIIFALWGYMVIVDKTYRFSKKTFLFFIPPIAYILWMTIAGIFGVNPELSFWSSLSRGTGLLTLYHCLALAFVVASLVQQKGTDYISRLLNFFLGGAFIVVLSIWFGDEGFNLPFQFLQESKGGGLIGNSSLAATYLLFALFFGAFIVAKKNISKKQKIFIWTTLFAIIFSPLFLNVFGVITQKGMLISARGALVGIIVGIGTTALGYMALSKKRILRIIGISAATLCLVVSFFIWSSFINPETVIHQKFVESATGNRFIFWDIAHKAINERPLLGFGPENYSVAYQKYFDPHLFLQSSSVEIWNDRAHNIFFDTGVAGGWPAIILYIGFLLWVGYAVYRAFKLEKITRLQAVIVWGLLVAYLVQNLLVFDSLLSLIGLFVLTGVIFGLSGDTFNTNDIKNAKKIDNANTLTPPYYSTIGIFIILLLIPSWINFAYLPARKAAAFPKVTGMPLDKRPDYYKNLLKGSVVGDAREVGNIAHGAYMLYRKNQEKLKSDPKMLPYVQKDIEKILEYFEIVAAKEPNDYRLYLSMSRLYNIYILISDKQKDSVLMEHILDVENHTKRLSPNNPEVDWVIAQTLTFKGDIAQAQETLERAIALAPYIPWSHQFLLNFAKVTNNQKLYQSALFNAKNAIPNFSVESPVQDLTQ